MGGEAPKASLRSFSKIKNMDMDDFLDYLEFWLDKAVFFIFVPIVFLMLSPFLLLGFLIDLPRIIKEAWDTRKLKKVEQTKKSPF